MPVSERGDFENPTKSAYSVERYDSSWEREYMKRLERDKTVKNGRKITELRSSTLQKRAMCEAIALTFS